MANYYTESFFDRIRRNLSESETRFFCSDSIRPRQNEWFDIFLSYNIKDQNRVRAIYYWLKKKGFKVYVDFIVDSHLQRNSVTIETASCIQNRLKHSRSLIYAISPNAVTSKWMPWELGVVDGNTGKCMILPVVPSGYCDSPCQEYLQLYPVIKQVSTLNTNQPEVFNYGKTMGYILEDYIKM